MSDGTGEFIWYELMTPDPAGAKAFYEAIIGWSIAPGPGGDTGYSFVTARDGAMVGGVLALTDAMTEHGARPCWIGYIHVADVDAALMSITAVGGSVLMPASDIEMAGRVAMVADPGGAPFYVMTPAPPPGGGKSTAFSAEPNLGHCGWNELMARDAARETSFYTTQFGWSLPEPMDMGEFGKYQFIAQDGVQIGAIMGVMPETPAPMWNHYFWVPSIAEAAGAIPANGGQIINGPVQVPGDGWIVQGIDPQGAMFSLVGSQ